MQMTRPVDFCAAFIKAYNDARVSKEKQEWDAIWGDPYAWSNFMLCADDSVIHNTANLIRFQWYRGQPFRIDCVFCAEKNHWFPIEVAIEHENNPRTFAAEVQVLLSVRSPLKVGITYLLDYQVARGKHDEFRNQLSSQITENFSRVNQHVREHSATEYLFIIGCDEDGNDDLAWFQLAFQAGTGPMSTFHRRP
jgi:hypothetical protein